MFFTTIKVKDLEPIDLEGHLEKLLWHFDQAKLPRPKLNFIELKKFILENCQRQPVWRLNLIANPESEICFQIKPYLEEKKSYSLHVFNRPFYEEKAYFKKTDFKDRLTLLEQAQRLGFDDWIFFDKNEDLLETTIANLFWIRGKKLFYPETSLPYYFGVTLQHILNGSKKIGYTLHPTKEKVKDLLSETQLFLCNSMKEIAPVESISGRRIQIDWKIFEELKQAYSLEIKGKKF